MSTTWTQIRRDIAQQTGLFWYAGTYNNTDSTPQSITSSVGLPFGDNFLNGFHILLLDGSLAGQELLTRRYRSIEGDIEFIPNLIDRTPNGSVFEILPFAATEFLNALRHAVSIAFDAGNLVRPYWTRMIGGSPAVQCRLLCVGHRTARTAGPTPATPR